MKKIKGINTNFEIIKEDLDEIAFKFSEIFFDVYKEYGYDYKDPNDIYENCAKLINSFLTDAKEISKNDDWFVSSGGIRVFYYIHDDNYITYGITPELDEHQKDRQIENFRR